MLYAVVYTIKKFTGEYQSYEMCLNRNCKNHSYSNILFDKSSKELLKGNNEKSFLTGKYMKKYIFKSVGNLLR